MRRRLAFEAQRLSREAVQALVDEANAIKDDSVINYVPIDSRALANSAKVEPPQRNGNEISIGISFDGPHAVAVHETPSAHDPPTWKGKTVQFRHGGSKYLEKPTRTAAAGMEGRLAAKIKF